MLDLHMHTLHSDGSFNVRDLIEKLKEKNIKIAALTDHDTVDGLQEAKNLCDKYGIKFINGIEISTKYKGREVHILGYFINPNNRKLLAFSEKMKKERIIRNEKIIEILSEYEIEITQEDILKEIKGKVVSKTHLARVLVSKGYSKDIKDAFNKYLGLEGIAYVPKNNLTPLDGIKIIKECDGLAFLAHPKLIGLDSEDEFITLIKEMKEGGLDGIETYYSLFSEEDILYYEKIAKDFSLIKSAGSDFHGENRKHVDIGDNFAPKDLYNTWEEIYNKMIKLKLY